MAHCTRNLHGLSVIIKVCYMNMPHVKWLGFPTSMWVARWWVGPACPLFTNFKEKEKKEVYMMSLDCYFQNYWGVVGVKVNMIVLFFYFYFDCVVFFCFFNIFCVVFFRLIKVQDIFIRKLHQRESWETREIQYWFKTKRLWKIQ